MGGRPLLLRLAKGAMRTRSVYRNAAARRKGYRNAAAHRRTPHVNEKPSRDANTLHVGKGLAPSEPPSKPPFPTSRPSRSVAFDSEPCAGRTCGRGKPLPYKGVRSGQRIERDTGTRQRIENTLSQRKTTLRREHLPRAERRGRRSLPEHTDYYDPIN